MALVVAVAVVVGLEARVSLPALPVTGRRDALDKRSVVENGEIEAVAVPGDEIRGVTLKPLEEALQQRGLIIVRISE